MLLIFLFFFKTKARAGRKEGNVDKVFFFLMFSYFCASLTQIIVKLLFEKASNRRPCQQQKCPPATLCPSKSWYVSTNVKLSFDSNFQGKLGNCKLEDLPVWVTTSRGTHSSWAAFNSFYFLLLWDGFSVNIYSLYKSTGNNLGKLKSPLTLS